MKDARKEICAAFDPEIDPEKHILYRVDAFDDPSYAVRRLNMPFSKNNVSSGDLIILQSAKDLAPSEKFKMGIHMTTTGLSEDSQYLEDVDVPRDLTLGELKEQLLDMPSLAELSKNLESHEYIRIREKQSNGFFGRIFREADKTLQKHGVKDRCMLVVQILTEPEVLGNDDYLLLFSCRDSANRTYTNTRQVKITATKINDI